jgi:probable F420-dependent oxidoreductase
MAAIVPEGQLVYGTQLPIQSQSTRYCEPWEATAGIDELEAITRRCDANGFHYVAVCDHIAVPKPQDEVMSTDWWDTLTTLGYLAGVTEHVNLLSHVYVLSYRHPLVSAKGWLTLDAVSKGRAILGVGGGHVEGEFELLGADFAGRGKVLDESIDVVRAAFESEYPTYDGEIFQVRDAGLRPRPVRPGGPPIWVGGSSKPAMRRAAERGDGWLPQGPPEMGMRKGIEFIKAHRAEHFGEERPIDIGALTERIYVGEPGSDPGFEVGEYSLTGSPDHIAERLRRYALVGINQIQMRFHARSADELCDQIDAFGADVAPHLNA